MTEVRTVLITGHRGYIGTVMTREFQARGYAVVGLDSAYYDGCDFGAARSAPGRTIQRDIRDVTADDLAGVDAIVHLAGLSNDPLGDLDSALTYSINADASMRLAELARAAGVQRFVFASSCSIYGIADEDRPMTEDDVVNPVTAYAKSKVMVEDGLRALAGASFHPTFMRNATVYGLSPRLRLDLVVNNLTAAAVATGKVSVMSDGSPWRPLLHIEDLCAAARSILEAPLTAVSGQAFNIGRDEDNHRVRDVAQTVADVVPGCSIEILNQASPDQRTYRVDFSRIRRAVPAFEPAWTLRRGVEQLYDAYRQFGMTAEDLASNRYFRLRWINFLKHQQKLDAELRWIEQPSAATLPA